MSGLRLVIIEVLLGLHRACWTKACDHEKYFVICNTLYILLILQIICTGDDTIFCENSYDDDCEVLLGLHRACWTKACDHETYFVIQYNVQLYILMILQMICTGDDTIFCENSYDDDCEVPLGLHRACCTNARDHEDVKKKMIFCKQSDVGDGRHNVGL